MEEIKEVFAQMAEQNRINMENLAGTMKDTVVSLIGGLNSNFQEQRREGEHAHKVLMDQVQSMQAAATTPATPYQSRGWGDMKLMQNLEQFSGVKEEFFDWARHVRSYMTECPDALKLLMLAEKST